MKSLVGLGSVLLVFSVATVACFDDPVPVGADDAGGTARDGGSGTACTEDSDCVTGEGCAYEESDVCTAKGQCVTEAQAVCEAYSPGCACDGTEINIACTPYPAGFSSKPLAHTGACTTASDAGTGGACTKDSDCATGDGCAYEQSEACAAKGVCVSEAQAVCAAYSPGCACDGTVINIACTPYPDGYLSKPLLHTGTCDDSGIGVGGDAGGVGGACTTDTDCGSNEACGYEESETCSATGHCFAFSGVQCNSFEPGCACDGTVINIACTQLPVGYASKPLAHAGECGDAG